MDDDEVFSRRSNAGQGAGQGTVNPVNPATKPRIVVAVGVGSLTVTLVVVIALLVLIVVVVVVVIVIILHHNNNNYYYNNY